MRPLLRFLLALFVGLALLALGASVLVGDVTRSWFERDLEVRAQLALGGTRSALVAYWRQGDNYGVERILAEIAHDKRIMGAAACAADASVVAATDEFPADVSCSDLCRESRGGATDVASGWREIQRRVELPGGPIHLSAMPVADGDIPLGVVVLVQDREYAEAREARAQRLILVSFLILSAAAALITLVAARIAWRGWTAQILRFLRGDTERGTQHPEFQPILRDVRELVERIATERTHDAEGGAWTPQRLKQTLMQHFHGERVIVLANREPYIHTRGEDGSIGVFHPASGLVSALEPVMRACGGTWVAHGSGSADRDTVDAHSRVRVPPGEESYTIRRVWLTEEDERGYYYGFANEGLWPLCHIADARPVFRQQDWERYIEVNRKFADAVCEEAESDDPVVLVQDYHFGLAPAMIRERLPLATIIAFWHIPWPNSERFGICPMGPQLLQGMLGSTIIGFHTQLHCNNFLEAVDRYLEARIDREHFAVFHRGHRALIRPYPISIEWPSLWASKLPPPEECRQGVIAELGLRPDALIGVGVDRLDYTKGIEERLMAVGRLLERHPEYRGRFTFIQLAAPSRTIIERYQRLNEAVEEVARSINERFGGEGYRPIVLLRAHHEPITVFRFLRAADVCYVSSLHDGMNLVAKEFVSARDDEKGVLILSHFTGASRELTEAFVVNPYDIEEASAAIAVALAMPEEEQRARMRIMRSYLREFNVYRWAARMLNDAARIRAKNRFRLRDA